MVARMKRWEEERRVQQAEGDESIDLGADADVEMDMDVDDAGPVEIYDEGNDDFVITTALPPPPSDQQRPPSPFPTEDSTSTSDEDPLLYTPSSPSHYSHDNTDKLLECIERLMEVGACAIDDFGVEEGESAMMDAGALWD
jgi:hypothetical protein